MDGNGRWAAARGLPRIAGHHAGAKAVRRTVEAALELEVGSLTLYAFSSDNWKRPPAEVSALMRLFRVHLMAELAGCLKHGIRLEVIGRRDRLDPALVTVIESVERRTAGGKNLRLRIAIDYSARESIVRAAARMAGNTSCANFSRFVGPDVDLLIRTGGEQRLSDFLLWEAAYAELVFTPLMWPDFTRADLESALHDFARRERRYGAISESPALTAG